MHDPIFFPGWLRLSHALNIIFISFLIRSGLQIFSAFPRLYWSDNCRPGVELVTLTRKHVPEEDPDKIYSALDPSSANRIYTSLEEEVDVSPWLALPGHKYLGLGRHWHFFFDILWILNGLAYWILLILSSRWRYLVPTSWSIFPQAYDAAVTYLHFHLAANIPGQPFNGLQKLAYFAVIFVLPPFQISTGIAMSPAIAGRFPWFIALFGGRQKARTLHFLSLVAFVAFIVVHTAMVILHGFGREVAKIMWGRPEHIQLSIALGVLFYAFILALHAAATKVSLDHPGGTQRVLGIPVHAAGTALFGHERSVQEYRRSQISPYFWANGHPPKEESYRSMARDNFADWRLEVRGLVQRPLCLTLDDLRRMPKQTQVTKHNCIQGWSDVAEWGGVPLRHIIDLCQPLPDAHYVVVHAMDNKATSERDAPAGGYFYETLSLELAGHAQTILAYEMNDRSLPVPHGAPLRLRVETQLGFKMVKWIRAIEFVEDYRRIGEGMGGWREDHQYYDAQAGI